MTLHEWFEQQAKVHPDAIAVTAPGEQLTYGQLNVKANRLARRLREHGVGPDVLVALYVERTVHAVAAILAVLKAGGAYVPLDPVYPRERLSFILEDTGAGIVLTETGLIAMLPETDAVLVTLDDERTSPETLSGSDLGGTSGPDDLAYVIYTSGSTGRPKGVMITHRNVVRLMLQTEQWFHFGPADVWTCFHSFAFDFSVWEIWGALLYGGRVVVVPYSLSRSPVDFLRLLAAERVTVLNQTPSAFKQLMLAEERLGAGPDLALRYVIFGGEALEPSTLKPWFERRGRGGPRLINMYGITETTVHVTYRPITADDLGGGSVIGVPIPDLRLYILDEQCRPVAAGAAGEIFVGGAGVARGYLNRPALTAERFIDDAVVGGTGGRLYRTGDLARVLSGGEIEYLGRADDQVKIRGFRIELGEIESALRGHPQVRDAVVLVRDHGNDKQLAAFLIPRDGQRPSISELRQRLKETLAEYMVPAFYQFIDAIPLTANGKADRKALLQRGTFTSTDGGDGGHAPLGELEETLVAIWKDVLGSADVGRDDNFFDVGGSSLMILHVQQRLQDLLGREIPIAVLFQFPTIHTLAGHLERRVDTEENRGDEGERRAARQRGAIVHGRPAWRSAKA